ncbi:MAG: exopolysaccharide biosynthesis polyprenyl glycosylphosphotransferase [Methylocystis sp.]
MTIMIAALSMEALYHLWAYGWDGLYWVFGGAQESASNLQLCLFAAATFVLANVMRKEYCFANYLQLRGHGWRSFGLWSVVVLCAVSAGFLTRTSAESSRAAFVLVYVVGFFAIYADRAALTHVVRVSAAVGGVSARRLFLVGFEHDVEVFNRRYKPWKYGMHVVGGVVLRDNEETLDDDLALAAASARLLRPDDVFILAPWSRTDVIDSCVTAFLRVPARIQLGPERVLDRFVDAHIDKVGAISSLSLAGDPLNLAEIAAKRAFDIVASSLALILLSPLLLVVALLIKLDSPGPALFLQRRYGFNRETFRIVKFRTMTTMEDGRHIKQATAHDKRITRIGRFIRRYNIDELPQLFNVLRGEMSLVGPRPHALAHDQLFERRIALYARRHNVKPGITGWAQVNGLRGEIDTPEKIRHRVEHDLYYIDNWSIILDVWIVLLTVFSPKAYRNAV